MPYEHIEEILSRKGEKIAMFLTLENATGLILGAFPAYLLTAAMPFALRIAIVVAGAALGVVVTLDMGGMAGYERLSWLVRGAIRRRLRPDPIRPESLAGVAVTVRSNHPLPVGGPIQLRPVPARTLVGLAPRLHSAANHEADDARIPAE